MASKSNNSASQEVTSTLRNPPYTYLHLSIKITSSQRTQQPLDAVTALTYLNSALQQFLGITGTAIVIDILKVEGQDVWVRVPSEHGSAVVAAVSQWVGLGGGVSLRVVARGSWLGGLMASGIGEDVKMWSLES